MKQPVELNQFNYVVIYIWRSTEGGARGLGHVAAKIHCPEIHVNHEDPEYPFVSLWPGDGGDENKRWHKKFNEVFNAEHDHGPNQTFVFFTLDVLKMIARFNTLKLQTASWVMMPKKDESLDLDSIHQNCCTVVWNVLKAGGLKGPNGIFTDKEFETVLSTMKTATSAKGVSLTPQSSSQFFKTSSKDNHQTKMVDSGTSTLTWQALLSDECYGPDLLFEIILKAKKREVEKMMKKNRDDPRLITRFEGHTNLQKSDRTIDTEIHGIETLDYSAATFVGNSAEKGFK